MNPVPPSTPPTAAIGFDLGHGESAVARASLTDAAEPEVLEITPGRKSIISAIATGTSRGTLLGEPAVRDPSPGKTLHMHFKGSPLGRPGELHDETLARNQTIQSFARAVLDKLAEAGHIKGDISEHVYVGCPSSWSASAARQGSIAGLPALHRAMDAYRELLAAAGIHNVHVVPESRGAFLAAIERQRFTPAELRQSVLVIDIGSSTTDFTLVHNLQESPIDFGHSSLGAALIDEAIFRRALAAGPSGAAAIVAANPHIKWGLMLACRRAKEDYFRDEESFTHTPLESVYTHQGLVFPIRLDARTIRDILGEPQPALDNVSWRDCYTRALEAARDDLQRQSLTLTAILLTGGPSRMRFVRELTQRVFPTAALRPDSSPEFTIATGLAYVGRRENQTHAFIRDVEALCDQASLQPILASHPPGLISRLAPAMARGVMDHAIKPKVRDWRDGRIKTLAELEDKKLSSGAIQPGAISVAAADWLKGPDGHAVLATAIIAWIDDVQVDLQRRIAAICARHRIPAGAMTFDITPDAAEFVRSVRTPRLDPGEIEFITHVVGLVVTLLIAKLAGGGGIALIASGPVGLLIGAIIGVVAWALGKDLVADYIKSLDIPAIARAAPFAVKSPEDKCEEYLPRVTDAFRTFLADPQTTPAFDAVFTQVRARIRQELLAKAEAAQIYIGVKATL